MRLIWPLGLDITSPPIPERQRQLEAPLKLRRAAIRVCRSPMPCLASGEAVLAAALLRLTPAGDIPVVKQR